MNRTGYRRDPRYAKVLEQMDLLGITDVSTFRQAKNDTIVWRLPIKDQDTGVLIEVASFASGYVRNQGKSCHSNYQLNKRYFTDEYYPEREITNDYTYGKKTGKYIKYKNRHCKLISIEIERLEYLLKYCLKNYYIKHANMIPNGNFVPKWQLENAQRGVNDCGHYNRIRDLEEKLEESDYRIQDLERMLDGYKTREKDLEVKLDTIQRISKYGKTE